jgi:tripartite-type tricarboxylate transporter receptor subunit TctC
MNRYLASIAACFAVLTVGAPSAIAQDANFAGKSVNLTIGFAAGGGVDLYARTLGRHIGTKLPGSPGIVPINKPGAGGVAALNEWSQTAGKDGLSATVGALSQTDPDSLRETQARFNPADFKMIGGIGAYSQGIFIRDDAKVRLTDKSAKPVVVGMVGSTLRGATYAILWGSQFLGWNVKFVPGYPGTGEVRQALERGEVEMATFGADRDLEYLTKTLKVTALAQTGQVQDGKRAKRPALSDAPIFSDMVRDKIKDPDALKAFSYWEEVSQVGMWLALPQGTPDAVVNTYVKAFEATNKDPAFLEEYNKISPGWLVAHKADVERQITELAKVTPETLKYIDEAQKRAGLGGGK